MQALTCIIIYLVLAGTFTALSMALLEHENAGELESMIRVSVGSATCLLAAVGVTHFFMMLCENTTVAYMGAITVLAIVPILCNMLGRKVAVIKILAAYLPINVISLDGPLVYAEGNEVITVLKSLLIGAVWLAVFLVLGIVKYERKEIK